MKPDIKAALLRELALDSAIPSPDIGLRSGADPLHPTYRGRVVTSFASWDLLDLHRRREISSSMVQAVEQFGAASSAGRFSGGLTPVHARVEQRVAQFFAAESGLLFASRTQAVLTAVTTLCGEGWVVIGNSFSPLPLADAAALVGAEFYEFESEDVLRGLLERFQLGKRVLVVAESISSVTGARVLPPHVWASLEQSGAWLLVDESAALGVVGLRGAGSAEERPSSGALLGRFVGFGLISGLEVTGLGISNEFKELLLKRSRYLKVDPPPATSAVSGAEQLLDLIELAISQRERLFSRSRMIETALRSQGWPVVGGSDSPIISVWFESLQSARRVQEALLQRGVFVDAIAARGVRRNGAVVRVLSSVAHSPVEVEQLIEGFGEIRRRLLDDK